MFFFNDWKESMDEEGVKDRPFEWPSPVFAQQKTEEAREDDRAHGVARIGGRWRQPNYRAAYRLAAERLLSTARNRDEIDELAIPLMFLTHQMLELAIKDLAGLCDEVFKERTDTAHLLSINVNHEGNQEPADGHDLQELLTGLESRLKDLGESLPGDFRQAIKDFHKFDKPFQPGGRFRYSRLRVRKTYGENCDTDEVRSFDQLCSIPVPSLVETATSAMDQVFNRPLAAPDSDDDDWLETRLCRRLSNIIEHRQRFEDRIGHLMQFLRDLIEAVEEPSEPLVGPNGDSWTADEFKELFGKACSALASNIAADGPPDCSDILDHTRWLLTHFENEMPSAVHDGLSSVKRLLSGSRNINA